MESVWFDFGNGPVRHDEDTLREHAAVIFTTTRGRQAVLAGFDDAQPFLDRCTVVPMESITIPKFGYEEQHPTLVAFAERALEIARAEGLDAKREGQGGDRKGPCGA